MKSQKVTIVDEIGIHARPASAIVNTTSKYNSKVEFKVEDKIANAKSIINLMALGVKKGAEIEIIVDGPDENEALETLVQIMEKEKLI